MGKSLKQPEHTQRKNYLQRLTCLLPAPLRMQRGSLWSLWDRTSRSSVQQQTLSANAPTARNKHQQPGLNPHFQVGFSLQLHRLHNETVNVSSSREELHLRKFNLSEGLPGLQKQQPAKSHHCSGTLLTTLCFLR